MNNPEILPPWADLHPWLRAAVEARAKATGEDAQAIYEQALETPAAAPVTGEGWLSAAFADLDSRTLRLSDLEDN